MAECSGTSVPKEADESNNDNQANRINALIKELAELRNEYNKAKKIRNFWWAQESGLSATVALTKIRCEKLEQKETDLKASISKITEQEAIVEQEMRNLMSQRMSHTLQERDEFQKNERKYHNMFINAQKEYSNESLSNDIKMYQNEYTKIYNELPVLRERLEHLQTQCGFHNLYSEDDPEIVKIDELIRSIREDTDDKLHNIIITENILKNLDKRIQDVIGETQALKNLTNL